MLVSIVRTLVMYIAVVFSMRLMGKRQLGELQPAELVTTFLISNVASICIEEPELPIAASLVPVLLIAALEVLNSTAAWCFPKYARLLFGKPITVIRNGALDQKALKDLRIAPGDLMEALRGQSIYDPRTVVWGVIETNGSLSTAQEPAPSAPPPMLPVLIDRHLYQDTLKAFSLDRGWVENYLAEHHVKEKNVLVLLYNGHDAVLIPRENSAHDGK